MRNLFVRKNLVLVVLFVGLCFVSVVESQACGLWNWLFPNRAARTTYSAPGVAAPAPFAGYTAAYAPHTAFYAPQTVYRTAYQRVPVVTYRPVGAVDPCTGCPTTTYRPVVGYAHQARMIPYTTYRIGYVNPAAVALPAPVVASVAPAGCPTSACGATTTYYPPAQPATVYYPPAQPTTVYYPPAQPATVYYPPAQQSTTYYAPPANGALPGPAAPNANDSTPKTFENGGNDASQDKTPLQPIPRLESQFNSTPMAPTLIDPENRTTSRAVRSAVHYQPVSEARTVAPAGMSSQAVAPMLNDGGWRASRD